jgi:hypothetical protein
MGARSGGKGNPAGRSVWSDSLLTEDDPLVARLLSRQMPVRLLIGLGLLMLIFAGEARACAICFSGVVITPGQKLDSADQAVLAVPSAHRGQFRIIEVVKGNVAADEAITEPGLSASTAEPVTSPDGPMRGENVPTSPDGKPLLLLRDRVSEKWTSVGAIDVQYAAWLRRLAASNHGEGTNPARIWPQPTLTGSYLTDAEWRERIAIVADHLESTEPLVAEIAYGELARAPYSVMRILKPQLDAARIATWINDPKLVSRRPAYTLLLGIAGGPDDAVELEQNIDVALTAGDATNLSAMLAADLELHGATRVAWIENRYFADRQRTLPEIEAALLALSVHGGANGVVPRERVIQAYRYFIKVRKPMAGFVAMELADWEAWDATADYVDIIRSNAVKDPAGQFAIVSYLKSSPLTAKLARLQPPADQPE